MNEKGLASVQRIKENNEADFKALQQNKPRSRYNLKPAEQINPMISQLPTAELVQLIPNPYVAETEAMKDFKGVRVRDNKGNVQYVQVCGKDYKIVQHAEAFRPIIEGLTVAGNKGFNFTLTGDHRHAELRLFTGNFGYDGVSIGWRVFNSFTGHTTLQYGLDVDRNTHTLELVGYRQSCANGMVVKVPLEDAEIVLPEVRRKVETLLSDAKAFKHTGGVMEKIEGMQYIAEAIELLQQPIEAMIKVAQKNKLSTEDKKELKKTVALHVGKRYASKVMAQLENEDADYWGLYNAITYVASHDQDITESGRGLLENKAADLLLVKVRQAKQPSFNFR